MIRSSNSISPRDEIAKSIINLNDIQHGFIVNVYRIQYRDGDHQCYRMVVSIIVFVDRFVWVAAAVDKFE